MRVVIINKSDSRGGAAIVSYRLMQALREIGVDARMLVAEKLTSDPNVEVAGSCGALKRAFYTERLDIFIHNGFNRSDLFKSDIATTGVKLSVHPLVKGADVVALGWINQGLLSLDEIARIAVAKPIVWTMHDAWCATGICHHTGECERFKEECGNCPLLHCMKGKNDLSHRVYLRKKSLYSEVPITFVAVSNWLKERCLSSSLMRNARVEVIGNPFPMPTYKFVPRPDDGKLRLLMVSARLDDPIKGLDILCEASRILKAQYPELHDRLHLTLVGAIKDADALRGLTIAYETAGTVKVSEIEPFYRRADILLSPSRYETLPGTLVEAQVYGAFPVAFDSGGQRDIVETGQTGILATPDHDMRKAAQSFANAISEAAELLDNCSRQELAERMYKSVAERFSSRQTALRYIELFNSLTSKNNQE